MSVLAVTALTRQAILAVVFQRFIRNGTPRPGAVRSVARINRAAQPSGEAVSWRRLSDNCTKPIHTVISEEARPAAIR